MIIEWSTIDSNGACRSLIAGSRFNTLAFAQPSPDQEVLLVLFLRGGMDGLTLLPPISGADLPGVQPLWSLAHTSSALAATEHLEKPRVVLVGAGFIGFIVLNAMFKRKWDLAVVERESQVLPRMLDRDGANCVQAHLAGLEIGVHTGTSVQSIQDGGDGSKTVELEDGSTLEADLVILATGIQANLSLIENSTIATDEGILVNDQMQTIKP